MTTPAGPHLDLDRVADLDEGLLTDADAAAARDHLATCADCRAAAEDVADVRRRLGALPDDRMPDEVWSRMTTTLGNVAPVTTLPAPARRSRLRSPGAAALAAVAAGVALIAAIAIGAGGGPAKPGPEAVRDLATPALNPPLAGGAAPAGFPIVASGTSYRKDTLAQQVARTLATTESASSRPGKTNLTDLGRAPSAVAGFSTQQDVLPCSDQLTTSHGSARPVLVDLARYSDPAKHLRAVPVAVIVFGTQNPRVDYAYVVGPKCATDPINDLKTFVRVDLR